MAGFSLVSCCGQVRQDSSCWSSLMKVDENRVLDPKGSSQRLVVSLECKIWSWVPQLHSNKQTNMRKLDQLTAVCQGTKFIRD